MPKTVSKVIGILVLSMCFGAAAYAGPAVHAIAHLGFNSPVTAAPEIDPSSAIAGLTLLLGGLAVVRGRRFKK